MQPRLGVVSRPDIVTFQVIDLLLVGYLKHFFSVGPIAESDFFEILGLFQHLVECRLMSWLDQVFFLVKISRVEKKFSMNHPEILAIFVDPAFTEKEDLVSFSHSLNGYSPFF